MEKQNERQKKKTQVAFSGISGKGATVIKVQILLGAVQKEILSVFKLRYLIIIS